jgi:hypothetical protein
VSQISLLDRVSKLKDVWNDALMHNLVSAKPEKITQDTNSNLEKMSFYFGDTSKSEMRENDTFDPVWEAE